jgi:two-component system, chemotaxis family, CheB/CheR fusion protein
MKRSDRRGVGKGAARLSSRPRLIVGIGASAGGLEALTRLLQSLPADTGMAFVIVQHLDPAHDSALAQILSKSTSLPTVEVTDGLTTAPDHVYVIPPNANLSVSRGVLKLEPRDTTARGATRSIDGFFESLAEDQQERVAGVILSGTASDGTLGLEAIKAEGGITFAQDDTARYASMPRSAIATGCVDFVLPPEGIAAELGRIGASYPAHTHAGIEELHLLDGRLWIDERELFPGDYNYGPPGAGDDRVWSETGCTCVLITSTKDVLR